MENRSEEDYKLSQGTYGPEKHQEGLGKPDLCEVDQETEDGQAELVVGLEVACVASVSNRVIARKLERKQKKG